MSSRCVKKSTTVMSKLIIPLVNTRDDDDDDDDNEYNYIVYPNIRQSPFTTLNYL
jgi:hypothetical protein